MKRQKTRRKNCDFIDDTFLQQYKEFQLLPNRKMYAESLK